MKIGTFQPLALKKELIHTSKTGTLIKANAFHIKFIPAEENKLAFIIKKKLGSAVARNKIKRRFREIIRNLAPTDKNIHCLIIAKNEAFNYTFDKLKNETNKIFLKLRNPQNH